MKNSELEHKNLNQNVELIKSGYSEDGFDYDLLLTDSKGRKFALVYCGNLDLYFMSAELNDEFYDSPFEQFVLTDDNSSFFRKFNSVLNKANKDIHIAKNIENNKLVFYSDDEMIKNASKIEMWHKGKDIVIDLLKKPSRYSKYSNAIRFNTNRSRNIYIVMEFMKIFNELKKEEMQRLQTLGQKNIDEIEGQPWLDLEI